MATAAFSLSKMNALANDWMRILYARTSSSGVQISCRIRRTLAAILLLHSPVGDNGLNQMRCVVSSPESPKNCQSFHGAKANAYCGLNTIIGILLV